MVMKKKNETKQYDSEMLINALNSLVTKIEKEKSIINDLGFKYLNVREQAENAIAKKEVESSLERSRTADQLFSELNESKETLNQLEKELNSQREGALALYKDFNEESNRIREQYNAKVEQWKVIRNAYFQNILEMYNLSAKYQSKYQRNIRSIDRIYGFSSDKELPTYGHDVFGSSFPMLATGAYDLTYAGFYHGVQTAEIKAWSESMKELYKGQTMEEFLLEMEIKEELRTGALIQKSIEEETKKRKEFEKNYSERKRLTDEFVKSKEEKKASLKEKIKKELGM